MTASLRNQPRQNSITLAALLVPSTTRSGGGGAEFSFLLSPTGFSCIMNRADLHIIPFQDSGLDNDVIVVGATNRAELLDAALMRPGRFDKIIYVPLPDETSRLEILRVATKHTPLSADVDLSDIASRTEGFSGADLDNACKEAALHAMTIHGLDQVQHVTQADFKHVLMEKFKIK